MHFHIKKWSTGKILRLNSPDKNPEIYTFFNSAMMGCGVYNKLATAIGLQMVL